MKKFSRVVFILCIVHAVSLTAKAGNEADGWTISTTDCKSRYAGVPMANGCIGMMPSRAPFEIKSVILSNVYDGKKNHGVRSLAKGLNPFVLEMAIDGEKVTEKGMSSWSRTLDMKRAVLDTRFAWGRKAEIVCSMRALRSLPYAGLVTVDIKAISDISVRLGNTIQAPKGYVVRDSTGVSIVNRRKEYDITRLRVETPHRSVLLCGASCMFTTDGPLPQRVKVRKGETLRVYLVGAICSSEDFADPWNEAERIVSYAIGETPAGLVSRHEELWDSLWQGDIIIEGDEEAQRIVRSALFQMYSQGSEGRAASIPPYGLSNCEYGGHIFWDSELWMYPPMLFLSPGIARSMVDYRTARLEGARHKAYMFGYKGALYPWESDRSGEEACPTDAPTGIYEHHISADVAIAVWNWFRMSGDRQWLESEGWPVLRDVADFWVSRASRNPDGSFSIKHVVGADEFAEGVDDNAFTNGAAICALRYAAKAAEVCGFDAPSSWCEVADALRILKFPDGVTSEYEGYEGIVIKQADVNLLAYPLGIVTDPASIRADLEYYEGRIHAGGPAMSHAMLALQWARLGEGERAYELFQKALEGHLHAPFYAFSETAGERDTCFMTGWGGVLQAVINGFCGLELTDSGVVQLPSSLPPHWKSLTVKGVGPERVSYTRKR